MRQPLIKADIFMQSLMLQPEKILRMTMKDYEDLGIIIGMYDSTKCKDGKKRERLGVRNESRHLKVSAFSYKHSNYTPDPSILHTIP